MCPSLSPIKSAPGFQIFCVLHTLHAPRGGSLLWSHLAIITPTSFQLIVLSFFSTPPTVQHIIPLVSYTALLLNYTVVPSIVSQFVIPKLTVTLTMSDCAYCYGLVLCWRTPQSYLQLSSNGPTQHLHVVHIWLGVPLRSVAVYVVLHHPIYHCHLMVPPNITTQDVIIQYHYHPH